MKKVETSDGVSTCVVTVFRPYGERQLKKGKDRYVLSWKLFLTVQPGYMHRFKDEGCSWSIAEQRSDNKYENYFKRNKFGLYNEHYRKYMNVENMDNYTFDCIMLKGMLPQSKYHIMTRIFYPEATFVKDINEYIMCTMKKQVDAKESTIYRNKMLMF